MCYLKSSRLGLLLHSPGMLGEGLGDWGCGSGSVPAFLAQCCHWQWFAGIARALLRKCFSWEGLDVVYSAEKLQHPGWCTGEAAKPPGPVTCGLTRIGNVLGEIFEGSKGLQSRGKQACSCLMPKECYFPFRPLFLQVFWSKRQEELQTKGFRDKLSRVCCDLS